MGGGPRAEAGYYGTETGGAQVVRGPHAGVGAMTGLVLGVAGLEYGYRSGYQEKGVAREADKAEVKRYITIIDIV